MNREAEDKLYEVYLKKKKKKKNNNLAFTFFFFCVNFKKENEKIDERVIFATVF